MKWPRQIAAEYMQHRDKRKAESECAKYDNPQGCMEWIREYVEMRNRRNREVRKK